MRSTGLFLSAASALVAALVLLVSGAGPAAAGTDFGVNPVGEVALGGSTVVGVRVGQSDGFDRLSIEFEGAISGYSVSYVPQVLQDGVGEPVAVEGVAFIQVTLTGVPDDPEAPQGTVTPALPGITQVVGAGAGVEGAAHYGIGTTEAAGFRVLLVSDPNRLLIDVAHAGTAPAPTTVDPSATADPSATPTEVALTVPAEGLNAEPESPNEYLIYVVAGLFGFAIVAAFIGWMRRRRTR